MKTFRINGDSSDSYLENELKRKMCDELTNRIMSRILEGLHDTIKTAVQEEIDKLFNIGTMKPDGEDKEVHFTIKNVGLKDIRKDIQAITNIPNQESVPPAPKPSALQSIDIYSEGKLVGTVPVYEVKATGFFNTNDLSKKHNCVPKLDEECSDFIKEALSYSFEKKIVSELNIPGQESIPKMPLKRGKTSGTSAKNGQSEATNGVKKVSHAKNVETE